MVEELGEPWAIGALSGGDIGEDANGIGLEQAAAPGVGALLVGGYAGVAQRVSVSLGRGLQTGPFRDAFGGHAVGAAQRG